MQIKIGIYSIGRCYIWNSKLVQQLYLYFLQSQFIINVD